MGSLTADGTSQAVKQDSELLPQRLQNPKQQELVGGIWWQGGMAGTCPEAVFTYQAYLYVHNRGLVRKHRDIGHSQESLFHTLYKNAQISKAKKKTAPGVVGAWGGKEVGGSQVQAAAAPGARGDLPVERHPGAESPGTLQATAGRLHSV